MTKKVIKETLTCLLAGLLIWLCVIVIREGKDIQVYIINSIDRCLTVIIPSLFIFMALSGIIIESRIYPYLSKPFHLISKYIFHIPNELFFVFILGNIFGYPVGAKLLSQLVKEQKINNKTAEIMNCFCFGGGPAFFCGAVGLAIFDNSKIGMIILASSLISNTIIAIILCRVYKIHCESDSKSPHFNSDIIIDSVLTAGKAILVICITIVFCSALVEIFDTYNFFEKTSIDDNLTIVFKSFLEISVLSELNNRPYSLLPLISAVCSFGGICVLAQVKAIVGKPYSLSRFYIARIISSLISYFSCNLLLRLVKPEYVTASTQIKVPAEPDSIVPSCCLIGMIIILFMNKKAAHN